MPYGGEVPTDKNLPANIYHDCFFQNGVLRNGTKVHKLDNGSECCVIGANVSTVDESLLPMFQYLSHKGCGLLHFCTVRRSAQSTSVSCFQRHQDKKIFSGSFVAFVPLKGYFWTIIEGYFDEQDDSREFCIWCEHLTAGEQKKVRKYIDTFETKRSIYKCFPGSLLAFQASDTWHGTIIPADQMEDRQVCILTKLVVRR